MNSIFCLSYIFYVHYMQRLFIFAFKSEVNVLIMNNIPIYLMPFLQPGHTRTILATMVRKKNRTREVGLGCR